MVPRLKLLGVDTETIAENLVTVINQRLVRRICPHCKTGRPANAAELAWLGQESASTVFYGSGCTHCRNTGYYGRMPVYELLLVNREVADAIADNASRRELRHIAEQHGLTPILSLARRRVLFGETTMDEILRTVGDT